MLDSHKKFTAALLTALLGLGAGGVAFGDSQDNSITGSTSHIEEGPVYCEIQTTNRNGMIALEGLVHADAAIQGSYSFKVRNAGHSGNSNIRQGGNFSARAGDVVTLSRVTLGGRGAVYDASLEITANGRTYECAERVGGSI
jgi:hypothetical protein